jgi:hypothetical protein
VDAGGGAGGDQGEGAADPALDGGSIWALRNIAPKSGGGEYARAAPGAGSDGGGTVEDLFFPRCGEVGCCGVAEWR